MLHCSNLTVRAGKDGPVLLHGPSARFAPGKLHAVIGPSGCGKTTLLEGPYGLIPARPRRFGLRRRTARQRYPAAWASPQFHPALPQLTVAECLGYQRKLSVAEDAERARGWRPMLATTDSRLTVRNASPHSRRPAQATLARPRTHARSAGPRLRRGRTDSIPARGGDPALLGGLCRDGGKTAVCIHNLAALDAFWHRHRRFQGPRDFPGAAPATRPFQIPDAIRHYAVNEEQQSEHWVALRDAACHEEADMPETGIPPRPVERPGAVSPFATLLSRRTLLFFRDHGYLALTLAISFGFTVMVVIFALKGIPEVPSVPLDRITASMAQAELTLKVQLERANIASLASGLIMFQIILLTLMGANNGGREIAAERGSTKRNASPACGRRATRAVETRLHRRDRRAAGACGWRLREGHLRLPRTLARPVRDDGRVRCGDDLGLPRFLRAARLAGKGVIAFHLPSSASSCRFLASCSRCRDAGWVCRPFVNAYWSWSGTMRSMDGRRLYDAYRETASADLLIAAPAVALAALLIHAAVGIAMTTAGCRQRRPL